MPPIPYRFLLRRTPLIAMGAVLAHCLPWTWLRAVMTGACVDLSRLLGLDVVRLSAATFTLPGWPMRMETACTMIDLYLAAIPLLWCASRGWLGNTRLMLGFFVALMALNVARLVAGFWLFSHGVSWLLAHEVFAGVIMFAIFEWICRVHHRDARGLFQTPT